MSSKSILIILSYTISKWVHVLTHSVLMSFTPIVIRKLLVARQRTSFYRAMHFSAKRGIAIACRLSVRL